MAKQITADEIRKFVLLSVIEPARRHGKTEVAIRAGDIHSALSLSARMPLVCSAIQAKKFQTAARLMLISQDGPHQGANRVLTFRILP